MGPQETLCIRGENLLDLLCFFFNGELTGRKFFENFDKSPVPRIFDGELTGKKFFPVDPLKKKTLSKVCITLEKRMNKVYSGEFQRQTGDFHSTKRHFKTRAYAFTIDSNYIIKPLYIKRYIDENLKMTTSAPLPVQGAPVYEKN